MKLLTDRLTELFRVLKTQAYGWEPQTPERLLEQRRHGDAYDPLTRALGLGLPVPSALLEGEGLTKSLADWIVSERPAVSVVDGDFVVHDHWPPDAKREGDYVHLGPESRALLQELAAAAEHWKDRWILDCGSGAGALAYGLARGGAHVLGLDVAARAVEWSQAAAHAQGIDASFVHARIGEPAADAAASGRLWDGAVFNPPMMIPARAGSAGAARGMVHRDGGELGVVVPFIFLEFCHRRLARGGQVMGLVTNPIVAGRGLFFEKLDLSRWRVMERKVLNAQFNSAVYRREQLRETHGVERVELVFLCAAKK